MTFKYTVKKGDTANSIANRYGFRNYKDAGITAFKSGNPDKIGIGEQLTLANYNSNKVQTTPAPTPTVISSKDNAQTFADNKNKLNDIVNANAPTTQGDNTNNIQPVKDKNIVQTPNNNINQGGGDNMSNSSIYSKIQASNKIAINQAHTQMQNDVNSYVSSINTRLSNLDAVTASTISRIKATAEQRINEQTRINELNTNRVRAYGLGGGAQYQPIQFSDAVTQREQQGAQKIQHLANLRDMAIAQAQNAQRQGEAGILADKMKGINNIENQMRLSVQNAEKNMNMQYDLILKLRKEKQAQDKALRQQVIQAIVAHVAINSDKYKNMTPSEMEQAVTNEMVSKNLTYSEAYSAIQNGMQANLKSIKSQAEINKLNAQTKTEQSKQYVNYSKANNTQTTNTKPTVADMSASIPQSFTSQADAEKKRQEFVRKYGKAGETQWNAIFLNTDSAGTKSFNYPISDKSNVKVSKEIQAQRKKWGY